MRFTNLVLKAGSWLLLAVAVLCASGIAPQAYNTIQGNGSAAAKGTTLNLANNTGISWSCATSGIVTTCTPTVSGGSGGGGITVFSASTLTLLGTQFVPIGGGAPVSSSEASVQVESPTAATISNLSIQLSAALGMGNSAVFTWNDGGSPQALTCTISGAMATTCTDTTHSFSAAQGDELDIQVVTTGTPSPVTVVIATQFGTLTSPNVQKYAQSFTSQTSVTLTDNLNTTDKTTQCYDSASPRNLIYPLAVVNTDANDVTVTFSSSQSGRCIVMG